MPVGSPAVRGAPVGEPIAAPGSAPLDEAEGPHREGAHAFNLHRHGEEPELLRQEAVPGPQVLDDRDFGAQQEVECTGRVRSPVSSMLNESIPTNASPASTQVLGGVPRQEGMALEIAGPSASGRSQPVRTRTALPRGSCP